MSFECRSRAVGLLSAIFGLILMSAGCGGAAEGDGDEAEDRAGITAASTVAFTHARIFDGTGAPVVEDGVLVVQDGRIAAVGVTSEVDVPEDALVVEMEGRWLMPGLVNAHGHVDGNRERILAELEQYAWYGVTTVVSLGGNEVRGMQVRDEEGPDLDRSRIRVAAPTLTPSSPDEARSLVNGLADAGVDWIKFHLHGGPGARLKMPPDVYAAVIGASRERGIPVAVHVVDLVDAKEVVRLGGGLIAHSVRDQSVDDALVTAMREAAVCVTPTLTRELSTFVYADRPDFFDDPFFLARAAPEDLDAFLSTSRQALARGSVAQHWREALPLAQENMMHLHRGGVGIALGTDSGPSGRFQGYFEHLEMAMMVEAGLSPEEVLIAATGGAARCTGMEGDVGSLQPGARADFLVLDGNPLEDIRHTREIHSVWIAGNRVR